MNGRPAARRRATAAASAVRRQIRRQRGDEEHGRDGYGPTISIRSITSPSRIWSTTSMPLSTWREHGVLVIEPRVVDEVDEDLRVAGVAAARRDADRAAHVRPQPDLVAHEARRRRRTRWRRGCRPESRSSARRGGTSGRCSSRFGQTRESQHGGGRLAVNSASSNVPTPRIVTRARGDASRRRSSALRSVSAELAVARGVGRGVAPRLGQRLRDRVARVVRVVAPFGDEPRPAPRSAPARPRRGRGAVERRAPPRARPDCRCATAPPCRPDPPRGPRPSRSPRSPPRATLSSSSARERVERGAICRAAAAARRVHPQLPDAASRVNCEQRGGARRARGGERDERVRGAVPAARRAGRRTGR